MEHHSLRNPSRRTPLAAVVALLLGGALATSALAAPPPVTRWYVVNIAGQPVGSMVERESADDQLVTVETRNHVVLNRLGKKVEMEISATTQETPAGRLVRSESGVKLSEQTLETVATATDRAIEITSQGQPPRRIAVDAPLIGPIGVRSLSVERLRHPGDVMTYQTFAPELGAVTTITRTAGAWEAIEIAGESIPSLRAEQTMSGMPGKMTLWLDRQGDLLRARQPGPFGELELVRADAATARRAGLGSELPAEAWASTVLRTHVRIPAPRALERLEIELRHHHPDLGWPDFAAPNQTVLEQSRDRLRLRVERKGPSANATLPVDPQGIDPSFLGPNSYIQSSDPAIAALAVELVGGESDLFRAAQKLERWVSQNVEGDFGVVLAPATEVLASRRGTCTEYSILLTALARAAGIPARVVLGYVYVGGMFGGHAWTEVLVGREWIALDATLPSRGPADAARLAFSWTSFAEGANAISYGPGLQLYGQIDLQLLSYAHADQATRVPPDAVAYEIDGDRYRDPWLGIALDKPPGFRFVDLDSIWPEDRIVGIEGPAGERIDLAYRPTAGIGEASTEVRARLDKEVPLAEAAPLEVAGMTGLTASRAGHAALVLDGGGGLWILTVESAEPAALLAQVAGTLRR